MSGVAKRRRPTRWAIELTRKVPCQSRTVDRKKPTTRPPHPPMRKQAMADAQGPIHEYRSSSAQFGVGGEVLDVVEVGLLVLGGEDPADVTPPEAVPGRVDVVIQVGVPVVLPMMTGPPERPLLYRGGPAERHHELRHPTHLVAAVGEVPVVSGGDAEHPGHVEDGAEDPVLPADHHEEGGQRDEVGDQEGDRRHPVGPVDGPVHRLGVRGACRHGDGGGHEIGPTPTDGDGAAMVSDQARRSPVPPRSVGRSTGRSDLTDARRDFRWRPRRP